MNNIAPKLRKCWTHKIAFNIISKMLKQPNFFHGHSSTLPKDSPAKFYLSTAFGLSFMIRFVTPIRLSTFYSYLITKIVNRNLKRKLQKKYRLLSYVRASNLKDCKANTAGENSSFIFTVCVKSVPLYHFQHACVALQMAVEECFETHF